MSTPRILIVDDDARLLAALRTRLLTAGFEVIEAQDAVQAVRFARECAPDAIVLDVNLPAGDGFTVHERLDEVLDLSRTPILFMTGDRSTRISYGAAEAGAATVLYKPFESRTLIDVLHRALGTEDATATQHQALADLQAAADQFNRAKAG